VAGRPPYSASAATVGWVTSTFHAITTSLSAAVAPAASAIVRALAPRLVTSSAWVRLVTLLIGNPASRSIVTDTVLPVPVATGGVIRDASGTCAVSTAPPPPGM
jgi:hypothetical protein